MSSLGLVLVFVTLAQPAQGQSAQAVYEAGLQAQKAGDYETAERYYQQSLRQLQSQGAAVEGLQSYPLSALALIRFDQNELGEAWQLAERAEQLAEQGGPALYHALYSARLARAQVQTAWLDPAAEETWQEVLRMAGILARAGEQEVSFSVRNNYAEYLRKTYRAEDAVEIHRQVLRARQAAGASTPYEQNALRISQVNLAASLSDAGYPREAEALYKQVLAEIGTGPFRGSEEIYASAASNLSFLLAQQKRPEDARYFATEALRSIGDPDHPLRLSAANHLAIAYYLDGETDAAEALFEEVHHQRLRWAWADRPQAAPLDVDDEDFLAQGLVNEDVLISAANLANSRTRSGAPENAIELLEGLVRIYRDIHGERSLSYASALADVGDARLALGDVSQGRAMLATALDITRDWPESGLELGVAYRLGLATLSEGDADKALGLIAPYSEAMSGYAGELNVLVSDHLAFERSSSEVHEALLRAAWLADQN